jgi:hypothetical protein
MGHRIVIKDNFITEEDANILINEIDFPSEKNPYPEYYKQRFGGTAFPYNNKVQSLLKKYSDLSNSIQKELNGFYDPIYTFKAFGSIWLPGTSGGVHADAQDPEPWIEWSTVVYLNEEYTGGKIYFPKQKFEYQPKKYSAVFFPSAGTEYVHGISEVLSGRRYTMLFMHTSKYDHADPEFL